MDSTRPEAFQEYRSFIPDFDRFCETLRLPLPQSLRTNTLRIKPSILTELLRSQGYRVRSSPLAEYLLQVEGLTRPGETIEAALGYFFPQALTSAMAVMALDPKPGELVCDLCAAPGSKTTHMAQVMRNQGLIVANDNKAGRLRVLEHNIRRMGATNVVTTLYPGQSFPKRWRFDRVLVDAPCSGEGTLRLVVSPDRPARTRLGKFLPRIQRDLIIRAFDLLAEDGTLLYSTCTYNPEENEAVVQHLLHQRPAKIEPIALSARRAPGLLQWEGRSFDGEMERCWRIYPHLLDSVGFFLAKIRRRASPE
ncbi:MAG: RsmB/NOP family class I SAM-dependent RNA methyltransferase [Deltaproteobacteria bacterium]|nr:RsmB/NOP family class I SAM-dependent RNA methyltransferase [Deltaproteobacteria bacterium]